MAFSLLEVKSHELFWPIPLAIAGIQTLANPSRINAFSSDFPVRPID